MRITRYEGKTDLWEKTGISLQLLVLFASLFIAIESWISEQARQSELNFINFWKKSVQIKAVQTEPEIYFKTRLIPLLNPLPDDFKYSLGQIRQILSKLWKINVVIYEFDSSGKLAATHPGKAPNTWFIKQLYTGLMLNDDEKVRTIERKIAKQIPFMFGDGKDLVYLRNNRAMPIEVFQNGRNGMLGWNYRPNQGGIIIHAPELPSDRTIFSCITERDRSNNIVKCGFGLKGSTEDWYEGGLAFDAEAAKAVGILADRRIGEGFIDPLWWFSVETKSGRIVYQAVKADFSTYESLRKIFRIVSLSIFAAAVILITVFNITCAIPLRRILWVLFLASASIPLIGIAIGSLDLMEVYQQVLGTRISAIQDESLHNMVQDFENYLASHSRRLMDITNPTQSGKVPPASEIVEMISGIGLMDELQIRDSAGEVIYANLSHRDQGNDMLMKSMARRAVERFTPERLGELPYKGDPFTDTIVSKDDMGFSTALNHPGIFQTIEAGSKFFLFFYRTFPAGSGPAAFLHARYSIAKAVRNYLHEQHMKRVACLGIQMRFFALNAMDLSWTLIPEIHERQPRGFKAGLTERNNKPSIALRKELFSMALISWVTSQPVTDRINISKELGGFVSIIPASRLADHCILAFHPDETIRESVKEIWRKVLFGTVFFLFLLTIIGRSISRQFIAPLHTLGNGLDALGRRDFTYRLHTGGKDEMARLSEAFNDMMEETRDLELAKTVQEGLVPQNFPQSDAFSIHGMIATASDLGGDCLDCFEMDDGKIFFLVGDITGHGVGSALLMAFARAVTFHWSLKGETDPMSLTVELDRMLRRHGDSRLFMGIVCGLLDTETNEAEIVVRGHVFPLLIKADGSHEWIGKATYPLGIGKPRNIPSSLKISMSGNCALVCCTDGFIEATDRNDRQIGYDVFAEWAVSTLNRDARVWTEKLLERHRSWCEDRRADDLTIFAAISKAKGK